MKLTYLIIDDNYNGIESTKCIIYLLTKPLMQLMPIRHPFSFSNVLKGIFHPKMKIQSSFTHPFKLLVNKHKYIYFEEWLELWHCIHFFLLWKSMVPNNCLVPIVLQKIFLLCSSEERNSYRFATNWAWVNDDRIFIFGWSIPLMKWKEMLLWTRFCLNCLI